MSMASITADGGVTIQLKTRKHYRLIKVLIVEFIPHFVSANKIAKNWRNFSPPPQTERYM